MKTILKLFGILLIILIAFAFFASNTEYADFQKKFSTLSQHIIKHRQENRPAAYYQWVNELKTEWEKVKDGLKDNTMAGEIISKQNKLFEDLIKQIEADKEKAPDTPQILPE